MSNKSWIYAIGGAVILGFLIVNGHYIVRYVWLNNGQPIKDWCPLIPILPAVREVIWDNNTPPYQDSLLMLQSFTENIASYATISADINRRYCIQKNKKYRYKAVISNGPVFSTRNPCWDKVYYLLREFEEQGSKWLFWIDSDAIVSDFDKCIESIGNSDDNADIFICTSIYFTKNINTGAMLLRVTPWMHKFLKAWWDWPNTKWHQTMCHEQSALDEMISKDIMGIVSSGKIAVFGCTEFNSTYQHGMRVKGKFIQHYRGCSTQKRIKAFNNANGLDL